jgi:LacI family transcriptional regulator
LGNNKNKKIPTIKEIAGKAKVSAGTVDRVLHNRGSVSEENIKKVNKIIKELGYTPNIYARNLALNKKFVFACLLPSPDNIEYWAGPLKGLSKGEEELSSLGITLKKYLFDVNDSDSFKKQYKKILNSRCDGIITSPIDPLSIDFFQKCREQNIPIVFVDSQIPGEKPLSFIGQDSFSGGYMAGRLMNYITTEKKYLIINLNFKHSRQHHTFERIRGFCSFFNENKKGAEITEISDLPISKVRNFLEEEILNGNIPSGIFIPNSRASQIASLLENINLKQRIRLIGFDLTEKNIDYLKKGFIQFLINQDPEKQGYLAIHTLYKNIVLKQEVPQHQLMPLNIVVKDNFNNYI